MVWLGILSLLNYFCWSSLSRWITNCHPSSFTTFKRWKSIATFKRSSDVRDVEGTSRLNQNMDVSWCGLPSQRLYDISWVEAVRKWSLKLGFQNCHHPGGPCNWEGGTLKVPLSFEVTLAVIRFESPLGKQSMKKKKKKKKKNNNNNNNNKSHHEF